MTVPVYSTSILVYSTSINFFALSHRITITTPGKYAAIKAGVLPCLVNLLTDKSSEVRLNALKVILCENQTMYCI